MSYHLDHPIITGGLAILVAVGIALASLGVYGVYRLSAHIYVTNNSCVCAEPLRVRELPR